MLLSFIDSSQLHESSSCFIVVEKKVAEGQQLMLSIATLLLLLIMLLFFVVAFFLCIGYSLQLILMTAAPSTLHSALQRNVRHPRERGGWAWRLPHQGWLHRGHQDLDSKARQRLILQKRRQGQASWVRHLRGLQRRGRLPARHLPGEPLPHRHAHGRCGCHLRQGTLGFLQ